jgi:GNAT superfamily N-acetyltransferase
MIVAEQHGAPIGFLFGLPDGLQGPRAVDAIIIKTLAVLPAYRGTGLGGWLVAHAQSRARELGFKRVIHALMHESNVSTKVSARYARIFRRYELFSKRLSTGGETCGVGLP